ncbi:MAG: glycoside hydrolase [Rhodocyclaceae bacterium]|nr:MAG: glycoside hydrolase [Rhodocyclaceae bacterium]
MKAGDDAGVIEECARRSLELLHENLGPYGFLAARPTDKAVARGYDRVFGRDGALCAIAAARSGDPLLIRGARRSIAALAAQQAANGQIPKFVEPEAGCGDFWYLGCIDATLWWLIAIKLVDRATRGGLEHRLQVRIRRALVWLGCQEHPLIRLLQQNEASDWADIMPRSGFVLYTNALWLYVKKLYRLPGATATRQHANWLFLPGSHLPDYRRLRLLIHYARRRSAIPEFYLSYVNLSFWGEEGDVLGNLLALLLGMADGDRRRRVLDVIAAHPTAHPGLSVLKPIQPESREWRPYMERHRQNLPHRYHNGGLWPMIGGFWVLALAASGRKAVAAQELARLARTNAAGDWRFTEWFDGAHGAPEGMAGQTWNAALFLLAREGLENKIF